MVTNSNKEPQSNALLRITLRYPLIRSIGHSRPSLVILSTAKNLLFPPSHKTKAVATDSAVLSVGFSVQDEPTEASGTRRAHGTQPVP